MYQSLLLFIRKNLILAFLLCSNNILAQKQPVEYVNVFTGTSNSRWQMFPGATLPFGLVKLSPDNQGNVWNGGYEYSIGSISGFSHIHAMALSGLSVMPVSGDLYSHEGWAKTFHGNADGPFGGMWTAGYRSRYKKETEHGKPGYYSVELLDYSIKAELTSTLRCGMMRFTYPKNTPAHLVINFDFDTEEKTAILETHVEKVSANTIKGFIKQKNGYAGEYTVNFEMDVNTPITSIDAWTTEPYTGADINYGTAWRDTRKMAQNIDSFSGKAGSGIIMNFTGTHNKPVVVRSAISMVSMEQAHINFETELKTAGFDFDKVSKTAAATWNELLHKVEVKGNEVNKEKFYTNLYRTYSGKSLMNDVDGKYLDACHRPQQLLNKGDAVYSSDALWGTQWDLTPLWTLVSPGVAQSWVKALLELSDKGGWIPYAPVALGYSPIMGGQHQNSLIISAYQKGIRGFDAQKAYKAIWHDYTTPGESYACGGFAGNRNQKSYMQYGYIDDESGPASNALEYAYDDWCFSQFAKALGKDSVSKKFDDRSKNYKNVFNPSNGFMGRRLANGSWVAPFDSLKYGTEGGWNGKGFMEGTPYQYSFFAPHDVLGLMSLTGKEKFIRRLEYGFEHNLFDLGNQPCLSIPFLFSYAGQPWLTQKYTRDIAENMFNTSPYQGWVGEEDEGQLSAIYVLLSMGLFEVDGGCAVKPFYNLTTPIFDNITINLDSRFYKGRKFTMICKNNTTKNKYIQSALLNGVSINRAWLYHNEIVQGGKLELILGAKPNKKWGTIPPPQDKDANH